MSIRRGFCLLSFVAMCMFFSGCASMGSAAKSVEISVTRSNELRINGRPVNVGKLGRKLRSMGATARTQIVVLAPEDMSEEARTVITNALGTEGFRRVIFKGPKQVKVYKKP
jgi:biopolymer transport protein ExbD